MLTSTHDPRILLHSVIPACFPDSFRRDARRKEKERDMSSSAYLHSLIRSLTRVSLEDSVLAYLPNPPLHFSLKGPCRWSFLWSKQASIKVSLWWVRYRANLHGNIWKMRRDSWSCHVWFCLICRKGDQMFWLKSRLATQPRVFFQNRISSFQRSPSWCTSLLSFLHGVKVNFLSAHSSSCLLLLMPSCSPFSLLVPMNWVFSHRFFTHSCPEPLPVGLVTVYSRIYS